MRFSDYENFLKPVHLQGRRVKVTIARFEEIQTHQRPGKKERALCVYFEGKSKPLILGTSQRRWLMDNFGDDSRIPSGR